MVHMQANVCGSKQLNATVCDPKQRTVNTGAECGAADDFFFYSPWRRPGSSPVRLALNASKRCTHTYCGASTQTSDVCMVLLWLQVIDSCGSAGGRLPGQGVGGFGATYTNTTHTKVGDFGSTLPHTPSGIEWTSGSTVEVAWTLQANHGGGTLSLSARGLVFCSNMTLVGESLVIWCHIRLK
jgi:hypothetical protein